MTPITQPNGMSRREMLRLIGMAGATALAGGPLLAACSSATSSSTVTKNAAGIPVAKPTGLVKAATPEEVLKYLAVDPKYAAKGLKYTFGAVLAFTGSGSYYGEVMSRGIKIAVKHISQLGGPDFNVQYYNDGSGVPADGVTAVREMASSKIGVCLASYNDDEGAMFSGVAEYKILSLDGGGGTGLFGNGKPYFWGLRANTPTGPLPGVVKYVQLKMPHVKTVAMDIWDLGTFDTPILDDEKRRWTAAGRKFGPVEETAVGATDYSSAIQALKSANPDLVLTGLWGLDPGYFMKEYVTSGINKQVIGSEFTDVAQKVAGSAYNNYWYAFDFFNSYRPPNPWAALFVDEYRKTYGSYPDFYAANYYEDTFIIWDLIRRVLAKGGDPTSGTQLQDALEEKPQFPSVYGGDATHPGELVIDPVTHSPSRRPMGLFDYNYGNIKPLAYFNIDGADFTLA